MAEQQQAEDWAAYVRQKRETMEALYPNVDWAQGSLDELIEPDHWPWVAGYAAALARSNDGARLMDLLTRMQAIDPDISIYHGRLGAWRCFWGALRIECGTGPTLRAAVQAAYAEWQARRPADAEKPT